MYVVRLLVSTPIFNSFRFTQVMHESVPRNLFEKPALRTQNNDVAVVLRNGVSVVLSIFRKGFVHHFRVWLIQNGMS